MNKIAVANWKMYLNAEQTLAAARSFTSLFAESGVEIIVCPSYPMLAAVKDIFSDAKIKVGAQDVHHEENGPFTGDVSVGLIKDFARYSIIGHSERRANHGDTDDQVARKAKLLLRSGVRPLICVGENADEYAREETFSVIEKQIETVLRDLPLLDYPRLVFCYEPVWAISGGAGKEQPQPKPHYVAEVATLIRKIAAEHGAEKYLDRMNVLYGGSVNAKNVAPFAAEPSINGVLVGGASTKPAEFAAIVKQLENK